MLRAPVSAANSLLRSSDSAALPGNATVRRLSPCKNPPRSPPTLHPALAGCLGGTRALRCAGSGGVGVRCWRGRENLFRYFYLFGGEILFWCFYSFGRGRSSAFVFFHWGRNLSSCFTHSAEASSAFIFFHWVEESFSLLHTFGREESSFTWERGYPLFFFFEKL